MPNGKSLKKVIRFFSILITCSIELSDVRDTAPQIKYNQAVMNCQIYKEKIYFYFFNFRLHGPFYACIVVRSYKTSYTKSAKHMKP